jgi:serine protease Do
VVSNNRKLIMQFASNVSNSFSLVAFIVAVSCSVPLFPCREGLAADAVNGQSTTSAREAAPPKVAEPANQLSKAFRAAASRVLPAVVAIESRSKADSDEGEAFNGENPFKGTPFENFFNRSPLGEELHGNRSGVKREIIGMGSGFIIDPSGVILTNNHVVEGGGSVTVRLNDERVFKATEVKSDPKSDLAIIRIQGANDLVAAKFGDSDQMKVGDWVLALGQPFGLESTVTAGIISATHRDIGISTREHYFQTDAAINPGNSGGPLVNLAGEVIAINTAITTRSGGNEGIGFAVPSNLAHWVSDQLVKNGSVRRAYLGVGIQSITPELAEQFGVSPHRGALVTRVFPDTPAAKMGLHSGDIVTAVDGTTIKTAQDLQLTVEGIAFDKTHQMAVVREGKTLSLTYTPEAEPKNYGETTENGRPESGQTSSEGTAVLGIHVEDLTPELAKRLGFEKETGVIITAVDEGSVAAQVGIRPGMILSQVNRRPVNSAADAKEALGNASLEKGVLLLLETKKGGIYVVLKKR